MEHFVLAASKTNTENYLLMLVKKWKESKGVYFFFFFLSQRIEASEKFKLLKVKYCSESDLSHE